MQPAVLGWRRPAQMREPRLGELLGVGDQIGGQRRTAPPRQRLRELKVAAERARSVRMRQVAPVGRRHQLIELVGLEAPVCLYACMHALCMHCACTAGGACGPPLSADGVR